MADRQTAIERLCTDLDLAAVRKLLGRMDRDYFDRFDDATIAEHVRRLLALSTDQPASIILRREPDGLIECTVLAFDRPFEFSIITGMLAGNSFNIENSDIFTLERVAQTELRPQHRLRRGGIVQRHPSRGALIIDCFRGRLIGSPDYDRWDAQVQAGLSEAIELLSCGDESSAERAKRLVNERVTQWLIARRSATSGELRPTLAMDIQIEQLPGRARLHLHAQDAPAFLYALSTALSLHSLSIKKMRIRTPGGKAVDEVEFVSTCGQRTLDAGQLEHIKLSVLLTQHFAYFLDSSPDPFTALSRFEKLAEQIIQLPQRGQWFELLANPRAMADLARVLGASDFLWEDFIRVNAEMLLPIFRPHLEDRAICPPSRTIPLRLHEMMRDATTIDEKRVRLNEFKDRELFLIDLDHILSRENPETSFALLSERLVFLAENLVATATRLVYQELVRLYGRPLDERGNDVPHAVFGLGKLGGVALGYASDIELLYLYGAPGKTAGAQHPPIANSQFFIELASQVSQFIRAKREGIFHVDLRLRPFGKAGLLALCTQQFREYYGPGGQAHPFEKLALVRMRWIAGDARLGFEIEKLRDAFLYEGEPLDLDALWDLWAKMHAQHLKTRQLNSKYSPGALADLEGAVQLLQVLHGRAAPQLRTPRLHEAIESLHRAGILPPQQLDTIMAAYQFIRRLINAQRMLRGSAKDLFLPAPGSDELTHLARRMDPTLAAAPDAGQRLLTDFGEHTQSVRRFIQDHFHRPCPGATGSG